MLTCTFGGLARCGWGISCVSECEAMRAAVQLVLGCRRDKRDGHLAEHAAAGGGERHAGLQKHGHRKEMISPLTESTETGFEQKVFPVEEYHYDAHHRATGWQAYHEFGHLQITCRTCVQNLRAEPD